MIRFRVSLVLGIAAVAAALGAAPASAQQVLPCDQGESQYSKVSKAPRYEIGPTEIVELESRADGASIQMAVVRPVVPEGTRVPVILQAGPYFHPLQTVDVRKCAPNLIENFVPQGYAVALLAVRGTGDSGGCMDLMGPLERGDIDQAITWLGQRRWSTGAVGMSGISYDGGTQWEAASFGNPHLKTIVPASGVPDLFRLMFGAATPDWRGAALLNNIYYAQSAVLFAPGRSPQHTAEVVACPDYAVANAANAHSQSTGEVDPAGYWAARRYVDEIERRYRGSVLLVQGLQDWNVNPGQQYPLIQRLEKRGITTKYMLGQWGHSYPDTNGDGAEQRDDWADILLGWYDRWLKNDRTATIAPKAHVQDSDGKWREDKAWPPRGKERKLWLGADDGLASKPAGEEETRPLALDPAHTQGGYLITDGTPDCASPACAAFETAPIVNGMRFSGQPRLQLTVTPEGPLGHVSAYVYSVAKDGTAERLGWAQADLRFPRGDDERRTVTPGEPTKLDFRIQPLDAVVPAGAKLVLVLSQGTAHNRVPSTPPAPIQLTVGGRASALTLTSARPS